MGVGYLELVSTSFMCRYESGLDERWLTHR